jgi:hypothetical protein
VPGSGATPVDLVDSLTDWTWRPKTYCRYLTLEECAGSVPTRPASPPTPILSIAPPWRGS